jgi:hypothetical protein
MTIADHNAGREVQRSAAGRHRHKTNKTTKGNKEMNIGFL